MAYKILIVEDEQEIINLICNRLDTTKYHLTIAKDGLSASQMIKESYFDLVTLDIMLPNIDGLSLCNQLRSLSTETLIIIVSALDLDESKEEAYSLGADDYIPKPFSAKLLALKIESLLKRRFELTKTDYELRRTLNYNEALKSFFINNNRLELTLSEYTILETLYNNKQKIFSNDELSQILYNEDIGNIQQTGIKTHIYSLRKKISVFSDEEIIKTIRNIGYTLYET